MEKKDFITVFLSVLALGLSTFNTLWQYQEFRERSFQPDLTISSVGAIELHGQEFDWKVNFTVVLRIATPHNLKVSIVTPEDYLYIDSRVYDMLVHEYPLSIHISNNVDEYAGQGVSTIQLTVPVVAKFLLGGLYQAQYSTLAIGRLHFFIHLKDLHSAAITTLETDADVVWIKS